MLTRRSTLTLLRTSLTSHSIPTVNYTQPIANSIFRQSKMPLVTISQSLDEAYTKHHIIPEVIDKFDTQGLLTIEYNQHEQVTLGNELSVSGTQHIPKIQFTLNSPTQDGKIESITNQDKFILVMTDPDAPSFHDKKWSEYLHWIVADLKLTDVEAKEGNEPEISHTIDVKQGRELVPYMGPGPPPKTGKHRYIFLLYKQDPQANELVAPSDRPNWGTGVPASGVRDWIKKNAPASKLLSVNFFYARNKDN
ncbi:TFS1 [[Candida] subhashii]|uniref:TFS1 n=1 Tax=[Candida] subhashii TaxID=561895 RepID=A0A8J5QPV7_9ASCO|nr:TFS1 [[Candida] subhashii]KAG7664380.1 TFS1 [[Candida] subhashii]